MRRWAWTFAALFAASALQADIIHLKNGRSFEGTITEESDKQITIQERDLTLTFTRSKIARIEKKAVPASESPEAREAAKLRDKASRTPPPSFVGFFDELRKLESSQIVQQRAKAEVVKTKQRMAALNDQILKFNQERDQLRAKASKASTTKAYNSYIRASTDMGDRIEAAQAAGRAERAKLEKTERSLNVYANQANKTRNDYQERLAAYLKTNPQGEHQGYFDHIHNQLARHGDAFKNEHQYFRGNALVVHATINQKLTGKFIVDTGASSVTFHRAFAQKLGLNLNEGSTVATLADGSKHKVPAVTLDSVSVGGISAQRVAAIITDAPPGKGLDGLLGMAFLANFDFRLDLKNERLVLNPRR